MNRLFGLGNPPAYGVPAEDELPAGEKPSTNADGSLYISLPKKDGVMQQTCMYTSCRAIVRPTAKQHAFELVVSNTDEDDAASSVYPSDSVFAIEQSARFECADTQCGWSDRTTKRYSLDFDDASAASKFFDALATALFEAIHSREPRPDEEGDMRQLVSGQKAERPSEILVTSGELLRVSGELFNFNTTNDTFETIIPSVVVTINSAIAKEDRSRAYMMSVFQEDTGDAVFECEVNNDMNAQFYARTLSMVWMLNRFDEADTETQECDSNNQVCLSIVVESAEDFVSMRNQYSVCLFEVNHQASMEDLKLKEYDREYIIQSERDDVEPMEIEESGEEDEDRRVLEDERPQSRAGGLDENDGMANSQLAVSASSDRTFVVRGNQMGVFQTGDDGAKFKTTVRFKDPSGNGRSFLPSNILLHEQDKSMLVLDSQDPTKMMRMDLERGEIVDTWSGPLTKNTPVHAVHRVAKYSNLTDTKEFVGLNKNQLLRMDPRTREFIVQSKKYAASTRAKLGCVATTGSGHLAVASENGDVRLYDQIGKNAKTHLPGLGDNIIGIDVSEDGKYILATTAKYLVIINTVVQAESQHSGFLKSMGKHKPAPRKLVIKPEDIHKNRMGEINFTPAHFNTGSSLERSIVTSTGPFIVTWNFRSVKLGKLHNYNITRYMDNIVADDFAYNDDGRIVVTLPNDVTVARKR
ncbi:unnamed protein product [Chondrus crispus]|uniref:Vacuolar import/degradation Vid27 C-terminal domain-containing protein n=1 Tax=Chondrus crispus TaxID=2769 RepID=R7QL23_CHOCR|nr:unnamed protein product [Chondrus crispus]CDF38779.1 unnamed protein product [Chondrus crispus]|eukprot:XP_005718684.1 unnamed protein product [Chondrus crispus]